MVGRLLHILLVLSMVSSTMGISLVEQFCQMRGHSVAAYDHPVDCTGEQPTPDLHHPSPSCCASPFISSTPIFSAPPCCDDAGKWLQKAVDTTPPSVAKFLGTGMAPAVHAPSMALPSTFFQSPPSYQNQGPAPPPLGRQIRVLHQSFLC